MHDDGHLREPVDGGESDPQPHDAADPYADSDHDRGFWRRVWEWIFGSSHDSEEICGTLVKTAEQRVELQSHACDSSNAFICHKSECRLFCDIDNNHLELLLIWISHWLLI